jgi:hypothetical protein
MDCSGWFATSLTLEETIEWYTENLYKLSKKQIEQIGDYDEALSSKYSRTRRYVFGDLSGRRN